MSSIYSSFCTTTISHGKRRNGLSHTLPLRTQCNLSARVTPYHTVAIKAAIFSSDEAPCVDPKALFSFCISTEWGGGSKHFFPSLVSDSIFSRALKAVPKWLSPWRLLSNMIFAVAGPTNTKFTRLVANTVSIGANTLHLFPSAKKPLGPEAVPIGDLAPG
jgi:hypothetical protein